MISQQDQMDLFTFIAKQIRKDIVCYAFGGNAMMYYGYKDETKDVDLVFEHEEEREEFLRVLQQMGYEEFSLLRIYIPEKLKDKHKPIVVKREEGRFDLFVKKIFQTLLSPKMTEDVFAVHEFKGKHTLTVNVLRKEMLVILKSVTSRDRDFDDIVTIVRNDKHFDWAYFLEEVQWQVQQGDGWVLLDVERMMRELKAYVFIPEEYF
ncbi:MAG: hypothetical protein Q8R53_02745, partial [Nanoarchaeota archaeon]|nr:hypothetical protein [Nanoarchaeota archaeon]